MANPGWDYTGMMARTASGKRCQKWNSQSPHSHSQPAWDHNYCRNPDSAEGGIWCYTEDPSTPWEYCSQVQGVIHLSTKYSNKQIFRLSLKMSNNWIQ